MISRIPQIPAAACGNRQLLRNAVTAVAQASVRQLVDIGSGLPTMDNTHDAARRVPARRAGSPSGKRDRQRAAARRLKPCGTSLARCDSRAARYGQDLKISTLPAPQATTPQTRKIEVSRSLNGTFQLRHVSE
jgi:hypothetical protein